MKKYGKHRKLIEKKLGRKLKPEEIIHHKDHNPTNNTLSNLEILTRQEHRILHTKGKNALYKFRKKKEIENGKTS